MCACACVCVCVCVCIVCIYIHTNSLIISHREHLFMCFQEKREKKTVFVTWGDILRLTSWRSTLFWIVFLFFFFSAYPLQDTAWGQVSFTVLQALWISRSLNTGDNRGWDGRMASLTRWTWVWVNSRSWWWTGRPGVLRFMGSQRVGPDWATELSCTEAPVFKLLL